MEYQSDDIVIIGGGAAGFFAAINAKIHHPDRKVVILEKSKNVLSKVKISGGGRCNVTNATFGIADLAKNYPRGHKALKKVFTQFKVQDTIDWFEQRGVELVTQSDSCIFPKSQNSQTVIDCFLKECKQLGIKIITEAPVVGLTVSDGVFTALIRGGEEYTAANVICTIGGQPKKSGFNLLENLSHILVDPVPSLFTFNMPSEEVKSLMGVVVNPVSTRIQNTKISETGPLLITHWGMSGPAILKLSAWGARQLHNADYNFNLQVNWLNDLNNSEAHLLLQKGIELYGQKKISNQKIVEIPTRLWQFLLKKIELNQNKKWSELSKKECNKIVEVLVNDIYHVEGKTTFKEEFVTAGGIDLSEVNFSTMESKRFKGLYFAGEALDIDGITGGFNFQSAWSTAFVASKL